MLHRPSLIWSARSRTDAKDDRRSPFERAVARLALWRPPLLAHVRVIFALLPPNPSRDYRPRWKHHAVPATTTLRTADGVRPIVAEPGRDSSRKRNECKRWGTWRIRKSRAEDSRRTRTTSSRAEPISRCVLGSTRTPSLLAVNETQNERFPNWSTWGVLCVRMRVQQRKLCQQISLLQASLRSW